MARTKLNEEEMTFLAPLEPKLKTAVEARWVSHLPQSAIDGMLDIWESLTGTKRPFRHGCETCILHLCIDLGTLYFAQKDYEKRIAAELAARKKAEEAAKKKEEAEAQGGSSEKPNPQAAEKQEKAPNAPKGAKTSKPTAGAKKPASGKNSKQK